MKWINICHCYQSLLVHLNHLISNGVFCRFSSPSFGSDAAGSASDDTVNVWQVSVVPCAVPGAYLTERKMVYNSIKLKQ